MTNYGDHVEFGDSGWESLPDGSHRNNATGEVITEDGSVYINGELIEGPDEEDDR